MKLLLFGHWVVEILLEYRCCKMKLYSQQLQANVPWKARWGLTVIRVWKKIIKMRGSSGTLEKCNQSWIMVKQDIHIQGGSKESHVQKDKNVLRGRPSCGHMTCLEAAEELWVQLPPANANEPDETERVFLTALDLARLGSIFGRELELVTGQQQKRTNEEGEKWWVFGAQESYGYITEL